MLNLHFSETIETMISTPKTKDIVATMTDSIGGSTGNHLGVPKPPETNPNLLSPEILNQRRGKLNNCNKFKKKIYKYIIISF